MDEKQQLIKKLERIIGYIPPGTRDILSVLGHPELIDSSKRYLESISTGIDPCEAHIRIFGMSLACMGEFDHAGDHYVLIEDDFTETPVRISWARKVKPE